MPSMSQAKSVGHDSNDLDVTPPAQEASPAAALADAGGNSLMQSIMGDGGGSGEGCGYTVKRGDTLWDIARRNGTTVSEIWDRNRDVIGDNPDLIFPGQEYQLCEDIADAETTEQEAEATGEALEETELTPEQRLAAAETAREGLEDQLNGMDRLPAGERAAVLQRVQGLEGAALVREMAMIENALSGPNGDRAMHTLANLQEILDEDEDNAERLTPDMIEMMVNGVANRRSDSDRGQEGVMGATHARDAARALLEMTDEQYASTQTMLNGAARDEEGNAIEGADRGMEQALIMKALGARHTRIETDIFQDIGSFLGADTEADVAMSEVQGFADAIRGMDRFEMVRQTTLIDVHDENTSTLDPRNPTRNLDANPNNDDTVGDNDGMYQRYTDSCAPTTAQIVRGEVDPVYALNLQRTGNDPANGTDVANQQHDVLEDNGGGAVSRLGRAARTDLTGQMDQMQAAGNLSSQQRTAMTLMSQGQTLTPAQQTQAQGALDALRAANNGRPTDAELAAMQSNQGVSAGGMRTATALEEVVGEGTDIEFDYTNTDGPGVANGDLSTIEDALMDGQEVPIRVKWSSGGHAMLITDVRRDEAGNRQFMMSEPVTGATRWVSQADFQSGAFTNGTFGIGSGTVRGYFTEDQD